MNVDAIVEQEMAELLKLGIMHEQAVRDAIRRATQAAQRPTPQGYVYLASPYSHPDPAVREARFQQICNITADLMNDGVIVFSPIAHSHPIALGRTLPTDWSFWKHVDSAFILRADKLIVAMMDGWTESVGVQAEVNIATDADIPVEYLEVESWTLLTCPTL